jgi:hypothetical protein
LPEISWAISKKKSKRRLLMGPTAKDYARALRTTGVDPAQSVLDHEDWNTGESTSIDGNTFLNWFDSGQLSVEANRNSTLICYGSNGKLVVAVHNYYSESLGSNACWVRPGRSEAALSIEIYNSNCSSEED